jgi:hypothetical protein
MLRMLQGLYMYVASICFKFFRCFIRMFHAFYLYVSYVSSGCFMCFIDVAKGYDVTYVAIAIQVCFKCMFHMFHLF